MSQTDAPIYPALAAVSRWRWVRAVVFRLSVDAEDGRLYLEEERCVVPDNEDNEPLNSVSGGLLQ